MNWNNPIKFYPMLTQATEAIVYSVQMAIIMVRLNVSQAVPIWSIPSPPIYRQVCYKIVNTD